MVGSLSPYSCLTLIWRPPPPSHRYLFLGVTLNFWFSPTVVSTETYRASVSSAPEVSIVPKDTGRRTSLPAPCPDNSHIGLMTILYNNIGKDLSRVSMPVALNEPLCLMQRLCEELEYSELLDTANHTEDPYQRMVMRLHYKSSYNVQDFWCKGCAVTIPKSQFLFYNSHRNNAR